MSVEGAAKCDAVIVDDLTDRVLSHPITSERQVGSEYLFTTVLFLQEACNPNSCSFTNRIPSIRHKYHRACIAAIIHLCQCHLYFKMDSQNPQQPSKTERFIRSAGEVREDPDNKLWAPVRWVAELVQYLIAIIMVTIGESIRAIVSGESPRKRRARQEQSKSS